MPIHRRAFMGAAAASLFATGAIHTKLHAIEPIHGKHPAMLKLSIAAYSLRDHLTGKKKPEMTLEQYIDFAAEHGCVGVEPTSYYFKDTSRAYLASLKARCARLGLDISGGAVGNNFTDASKLKEEIKKTKEWTERYSLLGAKAMRIFAGNVVKGDTEEAARKRCIEAIQEVCDHAAQWGVYMALENHGGIVTTPEQLMSIVKEVRHDWFAVNLDSGNFRVEDPYAAFAQFVPYAMNVQIKTEVQKGPKVPKEPADLKRLVKLLNEGKYRGYVALEYEAAEEPLKAIPRHLESLRKLM